MFKRRTKVSPAFNMASMTDIIFLLLIFFMITFTSFTGSVNVNTAPCGSLSVTYIFP